MQINACFIIFIFTQLRKHMFLNKSYQDGKVIGEKVCIGDSISLYARFVLVLVAEI